jgi:hypothetical protein
VSPGGVLTGQLQDQPTDLGPRRGPTRSLAQIRPLPGHQFAVPAQHRGRSDEERRPPLPGSTRDRAARNTRSAGCKRGRTTCRRRTATSWRKTSSSTSLAASPRGRSTIRSTARRVSVYISDQIMTTSLCAHHPQLPTNPQLRRRTQVLRPHIPPSRPGWPAATACAPRHRAPARMPTSASTVPASAPTPATWPSSPPSASTPGPWPPALTLAAGAPKRTGTAGSPSDSTLSSPRPRQDDPPADPPGRAG